jgi:hypothetical protein
VNEESRHEQACLPARELKRGPGAARQFDALPRRVRNWSDSLSTWLSAAFFGFVAILGLWLRVVWARGAWFSADEWDYLTARKAGDLGDLFRSHAEHWTTVPMLGYRFLWWVFGLNYLPYELFAIALHLLVATLLLIVMRRAGVGPWVATLAASWFVFIGAGIELNFFTAAMAFGLIQLLVADHEGAFDRRDWVALGAGLLALMCSGVAVTMVATVGIAMLLRRGWRIAMFYTAPLAAVYVIWLAAAPVSHGQSQQVWHAQSAADVLEFVAVGARVSITRVGANPAGSILLGAAVVAGSFLLFVRNGFGVLHGRAAVPIALLAGTMPFLVFTGLVRAGNRGALSDNAWFPGKFSYVVVAMILPAAALTVDVLIARWHAVGVLAVALLVLGMPSHIERFRNDARDFAHQGINKDVVLSAARLPLAKQLPRSLHPGFLGSGPSLGWLLDNLPSGRIPAGPRQTPDEIATETISLALQARDRVALTLGPRYGGGVHRTDTCSVLAGGPATRVLAQGDVLTLKSGSAYVVYLAENGGRSQPRRLALGRAVVALAGPLPVRITPYPASSGRSVLCT